MVRVQSLFYKGAPSAVYRLTLGAVPYPTHVFPPGGTRGEKVAVEFAGPGVTSGVKQQFAVPAEGSPWLGVPFDHPLSDAALAHKFAANCAYGGMTSAETEKLARSVRAVFDSSEVKLA